MDGKTQSICILGSTGSVGESTLDVIRLHPHYEVFALSAYNNVARMFAQCQEFKPQYAVLVDETAAGKLREMLANSPTQVLTGSKALLEIVAANEVTTVMAAIVGAAGLEATLTAVRRGKKILLANKESLVMAGELFMNEVAASGAVLLPIDSEHNAIFQCLPEATRQNNSGGIAGVRKVILTASGGPFLNLDLDKFSSITPAQACKHPRWDMGKKISVDSATLMNKGLEFIEACFLFALPASKLEVVIHPQSIVHSMVEYDDGAVIAQLATPDMRIPIAYGLGWPQRITSGASFLDLTRESPLQFLKPDLQRFPCLALGIEAARQQGTAPAAINAANEIAVQAFLEQRLRFSQIPRVIEAVIAKIPCEAARSLDIIQAVDKEARILTNELIAKIN